MNAYVVMGVSGCGKSTITRLLAERTGGIFLDADDFHPPANKAKMAAGIPLTDEDRWPWLDTLNKVLKAQLATGKPVFLACSALRQAYRDKIGDGIPDLRFIYLKGSRDLILGRLQARKNHFMPPALLDSQFATLEEPANAIVADITPPIPVIVENLLPLLHLPGPAAQQRS
jgi:gluconokinase